MTLLETPCLAILCVVYIYLYKKYVWKMNFWRPICFYCVFDCMMCLLLHWKPKVEVLIVHTLIVHTLLWTCSLQVFIVYPIWVAGVTMCINTSINAVSTLVFYWGQKMRDELTYFVRHGTFSRSISTVPDFTGIDMQIKHRSKLLTTEAAATIHSQR